MSLSCDTLNPTMDSSLPRAFSYVRFSSAEQAKGDSLRRQLELSREYAKAHSLNLDESLTFKDLGVSAFTSSNLGEEGGLRAFLNATDQGRVPSGSYLLVESLDRLSRAHIHDAVGLLLQLLGRGIVIVTLGDGAVYRGKSDDTARDFTSLLYSIMVLARAHEESLTKSKRVSAAWSNKRKNASQQKLTALCPAWLELGPSRSEYRIVEEKAEVVHQIVEMIQSGLGKGAVAKRLNEAGIPSIGNQTRSRIGGTTDKGWYSSYITKIVKSRALIGEFQPHQMVQGKRVPAGEPIPDYFPRLLTHEDFALLQDLINERGKRSGGRRGTHFSNLFTGLSRCGYCGAPMVFVDKGTDKRRASSKTNRFLVCHRAKRGAGCHYVPWTYEDFEEGFFRFAAAAGFDDFYRQTDTHKDSRRLVAERLVVARNQESSLAGRTDRLAEAIAQGAETFSSVAELLEATQRDLDECRAEMRACKAELEALDRLDVNAEASFLALKEVADAMNNLEGDERYRMRARVNAHLRTTLDKLILFPGGWIHSREESATIRAEMLESGQHSAAAVDAAIESALSTRPRKEDRFMVLRNRYHYQDIFRFKEGPPFNLDELGDFLDLCAFATGRRRALMLAALDR